MKRSNLLSLQQEVLTFTKVVIGHLVVYKKMDCHGLKPSQTTVNGKEENGLIFS
jgi:hypothetical protein